MRLSQLPSHPDASIALRDENTFIRYGELRRAVNARAEQLHQADCLAICMDNSVEWVLWDLAAVEAGIPSVPIPPFFSETQVRHALKTAAVTHRVDSNGLQRIADSGNPALLPEGTAKVTFTSGSTGTPKGVCLPVTAMETVARSLVQVLGDSISGTHLCVLPLAVLLENAAGVYAGLMAGITVQLTSLSHFGRDYGSLHRLLKESAAGSVILVPEIMRALTAQTASLGPLPALRFAAVGGSRVDPADLQQARALGLPVYEGYGLSECSSVVALNTPGSERSGTAGQLLPHVQYSIRDGEIFFRNPGFLGYVGAPHNGEFASGDLVQQDSDGFVSVKGRSKNLLILSNGRNISPEWIESLLLAQPEIRQAVIYGDSQPTLSALLVPWQQEHALEQAVARVNRQLPEYARITHFSVVPDFTVENAMLTGNGRIRREAILRHYNEAPTMTFFQQLNEKTATAREALYSTPLVANALRGEISRETYLAYLAEAYHHVSHTVRFLMSMGIHLPDSKRHLHRVIAEYLGEETGHEEWILNDIAAAGGDAEAVRNSLPLLETQVLIAWNYDYIQRRNPVGFLGMVFMLESTSTQIASRGADAAKAALGLPDEAFSYLYSHGELDIDHMQFFEKTVSTITDPEDQAAIIEVACNTFTLFANVLRAIPVDEHKEIRHVA